VLPTHLADISNNNLIMKHVLMIDNYDSFTWNLYEYICQEGAKVSVYRNDKITLEEIETINPDILFISPGPGHPKTDAGISRDAIDYFKGKLPIFGVCMGQQCIYEVFGGNVEYAGEIVHGKTSSITHDNKGMFKNVPQGVAVTRYHSLAGSNETLPCVLEVTAKTENGIIMGVRHKEYAIEGVQFHPESILTEEGHLMIKNVLSMESPYWNESDKRSESTITSSIQPSASILDRIYTQRRKDIDIISSQPGNKFEDLETYYSLGLAPKIQNFYTKLSTLILNKEIAIICEIKRASPSKGDIDINANAALQASRYANAGVVAISVLTEPTWFKGSLVDLENVRKVIDNLSDRPCVLRKDFIFSQYQILEARLSGADTVLLIVKMLTENELIKLIEYSRSLDIEPLVEVNTADELKLAIKVGSKVIGVNNRNLKNFNVDLDTTTSVLSSVSVDAKKDLVFLALSGISTKDDVKAYVDQNVYGFLIGESLMRKGDKVGEFIKELQDV
jgi:anthranilate synthase / indole-3-glycerol phosphate synthase